MVPHLQDMEVADLAKFLIQANEAYHNGDKPIMTDSEYDTLFERLKELDPKNKALTDVGAEPVKGTKKVTLPYYLGSMNKITPDDSKLQKWSEKYPFNRAEGYVISDKLDGISALLTLEQGKANKNMKLYTRGDGSVGQDISRTLKYISGIDQIKVSNNNNAFGFVAVRGELIVSRKDFVNVKKIRPDTPNSRNFVAGCMNAKKTSADVAKYIQFVAYELVEPELTPLEQMKWLEQNKFKTVHNTQLKSPLSIEELSSTLLKRRVESEFEVDGIIVTHNRIHARKKGENPSHSVAFKSAAFVDRAETFVQDIEWNPSKDGYLYPRVRISPIQIGGVTVQYVTGNNASFIVKNGIGVGAKIVVIRSGDVIPKIVEVMERVEPTLPPASSWEWDSTRTHIKVKNAGDNKEVEIQRLLYFFDNIASVKSHGVKFGVITKLYEAGHTSIGSILSITEQDLRKVPGFKDKSIANLLESLKHIRENMTCMDIMVGSNTFGRGIAGKKLQAVLQEYPNFLNGLITIDDLLKVKGVAKTTASSIVEGVATVKIFIKENKLESYCSTDAAEEQVRKAEDEMKQLNIVVKQLDNKKVIFTGFRDDDLQKCAVAHGASFPSKLTKATDYLVYDENNEKKSATKIQQANVWKLNVMERRTFERMVKC